MLYAGISLSSCNTCKPRSVQVYDLASFCIRTALPSEIQPYIYAVQQDTQSVLISEFIQHLC